MSQGHIRPRGSGTWELKFDLGRDPLTGKRQLRYITFKGTKGAAKVELTRLLNRRNEGTYVDPTKMTVAEYLEHWLAVDIDRRVAAKTAARHRGIVRHQIVPRLGSVPLRKLTATHIEAFEADLQRDGYVKGSKAGEGLTAQTVLHVHRTLSQALTHAVKTDVLFRNPASQVKPPRPASHEIAILAKPEVATLLRAAEGWLYLPVLVGVTTGIRRGELLGLRWSDIDLKAARLTVNQSLERVKGKTVFKSPKTKTSRRTITLPALTVEALSRHRLAQSADRLGLGLGKPDLVFAHGDGSPLDPDGVTKAFDKLVARCGVRRITFHSLRHTHISHQLMDGVHIKIVSERAGHSSVSTTLAVYAAFVPNMQADAAAGVDAWLREELGGKRVAIVPFGLASKQPSD
jgi:integrase